MGKGKTGASIYTRVSSNMHVLIHLNRNTIFDYLKYLTVTYSTDHAAAQINLGEKQR